VPAEIHQDSAHDHERHAANPARHVRPGSFGEVLKVAEVHAPRHEYREEGEHTDHGECHTRVVNRLAIGRDFAVRFIGHCTPLSRLML
jgi:hypothetical protein